MYTYIAIWCCVWIRTSVKAVESLTVYSSTNCTKIRQNKGIKNITVCTFWWKFHSIAFVISKSSLNFALWIWFADRGTTCCINNYTLAFRLNLCSIKNAPNIPVAIFYDFKMVARLGLSQCQVNNKQKLNFECKLNFLSALLNNIFKFSGK